ncbi:MAG: VOC family protein [Chloroflexi bacterium]|nr:MAG: VOC family protein [Chloroflexota bacterium]
MGALTDAKAHATVAVSDQERGNAFYGDTLALKLMATNPGVAMFECGGGTILEVYQSEFAGTGKSTAVTFHVSNLDAAMADLRGRGVVFEEYDQGELKTANGVVELGGARAAWFKDPDGNTLGVVQTG